MKFLKVMFCDVDHGTLMRLPFLGHYVGLVVLSMLVMFAYMFMMGLGMDMTMMVGGHLMLYFLFMLFVYYGFFVLSVKRFRDMGMVHSKLVGLLFVFLGYMMNVFQYGMPMMLTHFPMLHDMMMKFHLHMVFSVLFFVLALMLLFVPSGYMKK